MKQIKEVCVLSGLSKRTLQFYDERYLLNVERSKENYRIYSEEDIDRLWLILIYKEMKFGGTNDEKYDALEDLYDIIYDDACGEVYDLIYDDLMGDVYDAFYDGVVSDGYDYTGYEQWSDAMSEAYDMWSDSLSDVYDEWSDALSDIYDFWSDVCICIYDGSTEDVKEEITKFEEEIAEMKSSKE